MRKWNKQFFDNAARPDVILESDQPKPQRDIEEQLREAWQRYRNSVRPHDTAVLWNGLRARPFTATAKDMDFNDARRAFGSEATGAFGVPFRLATMMSEIGSEGLRPELEAFWLMTMFPLLSYFSQQMTAKLLPMFDNVAGLEYHFQLSEIPAWQEIELRRAEKIARLSNIVTVNEARAWLGLPPMPGGDVIYQNLGGVGTVLREGGNGHEKTRNPRELIQSLLGNENQV
jgi:HK97 family phage portal protein